jgi:uncharacterized protein
MATTQKSAGGALTAAVPAHIEAMTRPGFYPEPPPVVDFRQTHISYVFLVGERVFKVKKPACFPFLDATALATRRHLCFEEVRLNRSLAPDVYIGVRPVVAHADKFALGDVLHGPQDSSGESALDYAVEMRRLPENRMLDRLVRQDAVGSAEIEAIAERLADFHGTAASENAAHYGSAARVTRTVADNLKECERFEGYTLSQAQMCGLARYTHRFAGDNWKLINHRVREGRVCDGHGDLRCEHICLNGGITIFDSIEFSEALRYGDVASDLGFLAMDLAHLGAAALAHELASAYVRITSDHDLLRLLPYYACYRAVVRAKVESLRSIEPEVSLEDRDSSRAAARDYFAQACHYAGCYDGSLAIVAVCGPAASGKSTMARLLSQRLGFGVLSSDEIRKRMAGVKTTTSLKAPYGRGVYAEEFTRQTYAALAGAAEDHVRGKRGVILDATFRHPDQRRGVIETAARAAVPALFVECYAAETEVMHRLKNRAQRPGSVSDAGVDVYQRQRADFTPLDEIPVEWRVRIDTTEPPEVAAAIVEEHFAHLCLPK